MNYDSDKLMTARELSSYLRITLGSLYQMVHRNAAPKAIHLSRRAIRWRPEDVQAWLQEKEHQSRLARNALKPKKKCTANIDDLIEKANREELG